MNPDSVKSSPCPSITVYSEFQVFVHKEVLAPLRQAKEYPSNYDTTAFAKDFSGYIQTPHFEGYYRTFEPDSLVSLIQHYTTATKLRDLKVGDEFTFNRDDHALVAKSNVFKDSDGEDSIVVVLLEVGNNCPVAYTLDANSMVKVH